MRRMYSENQLKEVIAKVLADEKTTLYDVVSYEESEIEGSFIDVETALYVAGNIMVDDFSYISIYEEETTLQDALDEKGGALYKAYLEVNNTDFYEDYFVVITTSASENVVDILSGLVSVLGGSIDHNENISGLTLNYVAELNRVAATFVYVNNNVLTLYANDISISDITFSEHIKIN